LIESHEAQARLKITCLDSNSDFAVFTKSKFAIIVTQEIFSDKQTLLNRINFSLQHASKKYWSAFYVLCIFSKIL